MEYYDRRVEHSMLHSGAKLSSAITAGVLNDLLDFMELSYKKAKISGVTQRSGN